jgi:hypothetical protein
MIQNHFYAGYVRTGVHPHGYKRLENAQIIKGHHEPIVSEEVFQKADQMIKSAKLKKVVRFPDNDSVLTGLITCPYCGSHMFALNTINKHKTKTGEISKYPVRQYRCNNHDRGKGTCQGMYISANKVEPFVIEAVTKYVDSKKYIQIANNQPLENAQTNEIDNINHEIGIIKNTIQKYFNLFETSNEVTTTPFIEKVNELHNKLEALENKKQSMFMVIKNSVPSTVPGIDNFKELYDELTNGQRKELLRDVIQAVIISKDKHVKSIIMFNSDVVNL